MKRSEKMLHVLQIQHAKNLVFSMFHAGLAMAILGVSIYSFATTPGKKAGKSVTAMSGVLRIAANASNGVAGSIRISDDDNIRAAGPPEVYK